MHTLRYIQVLSSVDYIYPSIESCMHTWMYIEVLNTLRRQVLGYIDKYNVDIANSKKISGGVPGQIKC